MYPQRPLNHLICLSILNLITAGGCATSSALLAPSPTTAIEAFHLPRWIYPNQPKPHPLSQDEQRTYGALSKGLANLHYYGQHHYDDSTLRVAPDSPGNAQTDAAEQLLSLSDKDSDDIYYTGLAWLYTALAEAARQPPDPTRARFAAHLAEAALWRFVSDRDNVVDEFAAAALLTLTCAQGSPTEAWLYLIRLLPRLSEPLSPAQIAYHPFLSCLKQDPLWLDNFDGLFPPPPEPIPAFSGSITLPIDPHDDEILHLCDDGTALIYDTTGGDWQTQQYGVATQSEQGLQIHFHMACGMNDGHYHECSSIQRDLSFDRHILQAQAAWARRLGHGVMHPNLCAPICDPSLRCPESDEMTSPCKESACNWVD
jgi:hypothetical protein